MTSPTRLTDKCNSGAPNKAHKPPLDGVILAWMLDHANTLKIHINQGED